MQKELIDKFITLKTRQELAEFLCISDASLRYFIYGKKRKTQYSTFYIKKRNGNTREINAPAKSLRTVQREILQYLVALYKPKGCVYGFVVGRGIKQNANKHVNKRTVLNIDLKDFFSQINFGRIYGALQSKPYCLNKEIAQAIAQIACFEGILPQGAPTSPILTNIVCRSLDNQLVQLAKDCHCSYTRYADDITFSTYSNKIATEILEINNGVITIGRRLSEILEKNGFVANKEKVCLYSRSNRQQVTGLTVNKKVNVSRHYLKNLKTVLFKCNCDGVYSTAKEYIERGFCNNSEILSIIKNDEKKDIVESWFLSVVRGKLLFIRHIRGANDLLFLSLAEQYNRISNSTDFDTKYLDYTRTQIEDNVFLVESLDEGNQGSAFYLSGVGIITCYHVIDKGCLFNIFKNEKGNVKKSIVSICADTCYSYYDKDIDYLIFEYKDYEGLPYQIGNSKDLKIGDTVLTIGYPDHYDGNSVNIQKCEITATIKYFGCDMFTIKGIIAHGYSGGIVLNDRNEIVGIIKGGVIDTGDADKENKQGFVPIHIILESIEKKKNKISAASE